MEYVTYILVIVGIMALCVILLRDREQIPVRTDNSRLANAVGRQHQQNSKAENIAKDAPLSAEAAIKREIPVVPIPWGWPGHDEHQHVRKLSVPNAEEVHGVSESLHRFVERMLSEKQTVDDTEYLLKKDASLRALVEDRYGRVRRLPESGGGSTSKPSSNEAGERIVFERLQEIKTPWGW